MKREVEWHRLVEGNPAKSGYYLVGHRSLARVVLFLRGRWRDDVNFATHWAEVPLAPDDGTPQLFRASGQQALADHMEAQAWEQFSAALQERPSQ